jgi:hypothetical protein
MMPLTILVLTTPFLLDFLPLDFSHDTSVYLMMVFPWIVDFLIHRQTIIFWQTQVQFSFQFAIPSAEFALFFVPVTSSNKKPSDRDEHVIFREKLGYDRNKLLPKTWKRAKAYLPFNESSRYYLRFEVTAGINRNDNYRQRASLTNITISKECFSIGMFRWMKKRISWEDPWDLVFLALPFIPWFDSFSFYCNSVTLIMSVLQ